MQRLIVKKVKLAIIFPMCLVGVVKVTVRQKQQNREGYEESLK